MRRYHAKHSRKPKKHRNIPLFAGIVLLVAALSCMGVVFAKYVKTNTGYQGVEPSAFVFTSNYLKNDADGEIPTYTVYGESIELYIMSTDRVNQSATDVTYTITVDNSGSLSNAGANTVTVDAQSKAHILSGVAGQTYTVTATATAPYAKTLQAKFAFSTSTEGYYTVQNNSSYVKVDIYTDGAVSAVKVQYNECLAPDTTNVLMRNWYKVSTGAAEVEQTLTDLEPHSHYELIFFKTRPMSVTNVTNGALSGGMIDLCVATP